MLGREKEVVFFYSSGGLRTALGGRGVTGETDLKIGSGRPVCCEGDQGLLYLNVSPLDRRGQEPELPSLCIHLQSLRTPPTVHSEHRIN